MKTTTSRVEFGVSLPASGTLLRQVRTALDALSKQHRNGRIGKIRAFTTTPEDSITVRAAILAEFTRRKQTVPVISVVQVVRLEGSARVVLESVAESKDVRNPNGVVFASGQLTTAAATSNTRGVAPLAERSLANLKRVLSEAGAEPAGVQRVTCYTSTLQDAVPMRKMIASQFPKSAVSLMQIVEEPSGPEVECEAVARLSKAPSEAVQLFNPNNAAFAQAVAVNAPELIFTSSVQGSGESAFHALKAPLAAAGATFDSVFYSYAYPSNAAMLQQYRDNRWQFLRRERAPASTNLVFQTDAADRLVIEAIAVPHPSWSVLFDGTGLDNWNRIGTAQWKLGGGVVEGSDGQGHLVSKKSYRDFELHVEFWVNDIANTGVFIRCSSPAQVSSENSYEVNVFDTRPDQTWGTGSVVNVSSSAVPMKAAGQWNTFEIRAEGDHLTIVLNGVKTVDARDAKFPEGPIALQASAGVVRFRKVLIRELRTR